MSRYYPVDCFSFFCHLFIYLFFLCVLLSLDYWDRICIFSFLYWMTVRMGWMGIFFRINCLLVYGPCLAVVFRARVKRERVSVYLKDSNRYRETRSTHTARRTSAAVARGLGPVRCRADQEDHRSMRYPTLQDTLRVNPRNRYSFASNTYAYKSMISDMTAPANRQISPLMCH